MGSVQLPDALKELKVLALKRLSAGTLSQCQNLAKMTVTAMGIKSNDLVDSEISGSVLIVMEQSIRELAKAQRSLAMAEIERNPNEETQECQKVAAVGELFGIFGGDNDPMLVDLRRRLRGVSDTTWRDTLRKPDNKGPLKLRWICAGLWLKQRDIYSYKAVQKREPELLGAFLAAYKVYLHNNADELRSRLRLQEPEPNQPPPIDYEALSGKRRERSAHQGRPPRTSNSRLTDAQILYGTDDSLAAEDSHPALRELGIKLYPDKSPEAERAREGRAPVEPIPSESLTPEQARRKWEIEGPWDTLDEDYEQERRRQQWAQAHPESDPFGGATPGAGITLPPPMPKREPKPSRPGSPEANLPTLPETTRGDDDPPSIDEIYGFPRSP